jgi:hypothetical protein
VLVPQPPLHVHEYVNPVPLVYVSEEQETTETQRPL